MKTMRAFIIGIFTVCCGSTATKAQDVYLSIPEIIFLTGVNLLHYQQG